nr:hypothetical protein [Morchella crassipes]
MKSSQFLKEGLILSSKASFARIPPSGGGRIAPAEQPSCTRCVQPPPPRCARGGAIPPPTFPPPPPLPTVGSGGEWEGGWGGCAAGSRKEMQPLLKKRGS